LQCLPLSFIPGLIYWWMERISRLHSRTSDQNLEIVPNFQDVHSLMRRSWLALESREVLRHHRPVGGTVSEVQESLNLEDLGRIATCTESLQSAWDNSQRCISFRLEDHVEHLGVIRGHIHSFGVSCLAQEKSFSKDPVHVKELKTNHAKSRLSACMHCLGKSISRSRWVSS